MVEAQFLHFPADAVQVDPVRLARLPQSAQRTFGVVREAGPLTSAELLVRTGLPARTLRYAVRRLKQEGLVDARCSLRDCRTCYFFVSKRCLGLGASESPLPAVAERLI
ncbi:MAG: helix-turn-helix domain-containing protein [Candidatus Thermoplasmatota archaeon]